jgi:phosphoribosylglycinamide formyltransferase-1
VTRARVAVLASGGGSNLQALIDYLDGLGDARAAEIVLVASNRREAGALARAHRAGLSTAIVKSSRDASAEEMLPLLERHAIEFVVLAGYLQFVPAEVTQRFASAIVNVHPGPIPAFGGAGMYGHHVHRAVLAADASFSGPTVHFVDDEYDHGATIAHWPVPVLPGDDEHILAHRVLRAEHLLLPRAVQAIAAGTPLPHATALPAFDAALTDDALGSIVDHWFGVVRPPVRHSRERGNPSSQ